MFRRHREIIILLIVGMALLLAPTFTSAYTKMELEDGSGYKMDFNSDFSDLSDFTLNGFTATYYGTSASSGSVPYQPHSVYSDGQNVLRLVDDQQYQAGSAFISNKINLLKKESSFQSYFEFRITEEDDPTTKESFGSDGLAFVIQNAGADAIGANGGYMGYGSGWGSSGIDPSLAIEFDTYKNDWDSSYAHVGVDINADMASVTDYSMDVFFDNGASWYAWVDYDGLNELLEVRLSTTDIRPDAVTLAYNVDLRDLLGLTEDNKYGVYMGFTAATGRRTGAHDIRDWEIIVPNPEPSTMFLLGSGLLGIIGLGHRKRKKEL